jgi:hypothetical protein
MSMHEMLLPFPRKYRSVKRSILMTEKGRQLKTEEILGFLDIVIESVFILLK